MSIEGVGTFVMCFFLSKISECKKMHGEVKKASLETAKLQKKVNKGYSFSLKSFNHLPLGLLIVSLQLHSEVLNHEYVLVNVGRFSS